MSKEIKKNYLYTEYYKIKETITPTPRSINLKRHVNPPSNLSGFCTWNPGYIKTNSMHGLGCIICRLDLISPMSNGEPTHLLASWRQATLLKWFRLVYICCWVERMFWCGLMGNIYMVLWWLVRILYCCKSGLGSWDSKVK